jgi:hypothetical protein
MTASSWNPPHKPRPKPGAHAGSAAARDVPGDDLLAKRTVLLSAQRADCCVAPAAYRVLLPASSVRPHSTELLLCAHHYRASTAGLLVARAGVLDGADQLIVSSG